MEINVKLGRWSPRNHNPPKYKSLTFYEFLDGLGIKIYSRFCKINSNWKQWIITRKKEFISIGVVKQAMPKQTNKINK